MGLEVWENRPREEALLFNPAFCGALVFEFVKEFQKTKGQAVSFILPFCALTVALHPKTRSALPTTTLTSLYSWLEEHNDVLVGFGDRVRNLSPIVNESIRFTMDRAVIELTEGGDLSIGQKRASFTPTVMENLTHDASECVRAVRMLGRWLPKAGSTATILSGWGVRP